LGGYYAQAPTYDSSGAECKAGYSCKVYRGKISINDVDFATLSPLLKNETIAHEMGHILGLAHEDSGVDSIMRSMGFEYSAAPLDDDWEGIRAVYP
jgi:predicted Zn-dependent protease